MIDTLVGSPSASGLMVPDYRQAQDYDCGAVAAMTVADAFGVGPSSEDEFIAALGTTPEEGTSPPAIAAFLDTMGLDVQASSGLSIMDLAIQTQSGRLVICPIQFGDWSQERRENAGHYVVVLGVYADGIHVQDPWAGPRTAPQHLWIEKWRDVDPAGRQYFRYGIIVGPPVLVPLPTAAFAEDVALPGKAGQRLEALMHHAVREGGNLLRGLVRDALSRLVEAKPTDILRARRLFNADELARLKDQFVRTNAPAELLGRADVRKKAQRVEPLRFADADTLAPLTPEEALDYFRSLVPELGVDPRRFGELMARQAFTLAVATEQTLLDKVHAYIAEAIETGEVGTAARDIEAMLDDAGVSERNPGYSETVWRTNAIDTYNGGAEREGLTLAETFPVWQYSNPDDGRSRSTHAARNRNYYWNRPGSTFSLVRGLDIGDVANCRCVPIFIDQYEWEELLAAGAQVTEV